MLTLPFPAFTKVDVQQSDRVDHRWQQRRAPLQPADKKEPIAPLFDGGDATRSNELQKQVRLPAQLRDNMTSPARETCCAHVRAWRGHRGRLVTAVLMGEPCSFVLRIVRCAEFRFIMCGTALNRTYPWTCTPTARAMMLDSRRYVLCSIAADRHARVGL
jgi:hypothetical protein